MKVSIVTVSYNQVKFLPDCIQSVSSQRTSASIEHIIVDPGSSDGSRTYIESLEPGVIRIFDPDRGPADGLNRGFSQASGDIFGFLNSDDMLLPGGVQAVVEAFSDPLVDVVSGCGFFVDESGEKLGRIVPTKFGAMMYAYGGVTVFQQGTFFRRGAFERAGGFNVENRTCWDAELFLNMAINGERFKIIPVDVALFRLHGESITVSGRLKAQKQHDEDRLFKKVMGRARSRFDDFLVPFARVAKLVINPFYILRRGLRAGTRF